MEGINTFDVNSNSVKKVRHKQSLNLPSPKLPHCSNDILQINEDVKDLIKRKIELIESELNEKNKQHTEIIESFLKRANTSSSICPDILHSSLGSCGQYSDLKLKGGGSDNLKVKRYTSDRNNINLALNALRSSSRFNCYGIH